MSHEQPSQPAPQRPYEVFGLTEQEQLNWRVSTERFEGILKDRNTIIHEVKESSNNYGEFLFVTVSRAADHGRICMTFFCLGYHEYRERWLTDEWFWYQANPYPVLIREQIPKEDTEEIIKQRMESIQPYIEEDSQTYRGRLFELLADLTDEDGALAELEDLDDIASLLQGVTENGEEKEVPPTGENLLDQESREKLPPLYSGEEKGLDALAQVKFFTPAGSWTWYASEFDGNDICFGLVSGFEVELGYFSLKELKEVKGPMGLPIERDLYYEPKSLRELIEWHKNQRAE
jgi:hypothetical protein